MEAQVEQHQVDPFTSEHGDHLLEESGDAIENPSIAWPESRKLVHLGTISIRAVDTQPNADKELLFLPARLCEGIETADPMLTMRQAAYPISFGQRQ